MDPTTCQYQDEAAKHARDGNIEEALRSYDRILASNPNNDVILNNKSVALIIVCRFEEALTCSKRAASVNPSSADTWINMGVALEKLGRFADAAEALERAIEINPYDAYARALLGIVYQRMGREDLAENQNRQLQELIFPNEYAGFYFGTAAFLLGILLGGIHTVEAKALHITVPSQLIILLFFIIICCLYYKSLKRQQETHRNVIVVPYQAPVQGDRSARGMYGVFMIMFIVFLLGVLSGGHVWTFMH